MPAARTRGAEGSASRAKPRSDAYVGLLALSLLALSAAMVFAYLDYSSYPESKPKPVQIAPRAGGGPAVGGPAVAPAQGGAPGVPGAPPVPPAGMQGNQPPPAGMQGGRPPAPQPPQPKQ